jgi:putative phosphoribosyl transferase
LPRGGIPVAYEVAAQLRAPLDVFVVRKLGVPGNEELAMGALASGGVCVLNQHIIKRYGISSDSIATVEMREQAELTRREHAYREGRPALSVAGRTAVLIDDGLATGATMRAAITGLQQLSPARIVVGVPIAMAGTCEDLSQLVADIICAATPEPFVSVGTWYEEFEPTPDDEVRALLKAAAQGHRRALHHGWELRR